MNTIRKIINSAVDAFTQKMTELCEDFDISHLDADQAQRMSAHLKDALAEAGKSGYHDYIESFDCSTDLVTIQGGAVVRYKDTVSKAFLTPFGEIAIKRRIYQADRGGKSYVPLDDSWNMVGQYATVEVREAVCFTSAHCSPDDVHALLEKCALFKPSTTAIKHIISKVGEVFEEHKDGLGEHVRGTESIPTQAEAVVLSMDGTNVMVRETGGRCHRPAERPRSDCLREDVNAAYRNAMVGSISFYAADKESNKPQRICSRYEARMPQHRAVEFKQSFERTVAQVLEDPACAQMEKVLLMDGSRALWKYTQNTALYKNCIPALDFYHMTEHLSKAAEALFGKGSDWAKPWYEKWKEKLAHETDGVEGLLRSIDYYSQRYRLSAARRKALRAERIFFVRNRTRMPYAQLREKGLPIGSGPVEAACKSIVKTRLCRSGMRWSIDGGQHILTFRTLIKSNQWDAAWNFYKNHAKAA